MADIAQEIGLDLSRADAASFRGPMAGAFDALDAVDRMADEMAPVKYSRTAGTHPTGDENKYNP